MKTIIELSTANRKNEIKEYFEEYIKDCEYIITIEIVEDEVENIKHSIITKSNFTRFQLTLLRILIRFLKSHLWYHLITELETIIINFILQF